MMPMWVDTPIFRSARPMVCLFLAATVLAIALAPRPALAGDDVFEAQCGDGIGVALLCHEPPSMKVRDGKLDHFDRLALVRSGMLRR